MFIVLKELKFLPQEMIAILDEINHLLILLHFFVQFHQLVSLILDLYKLRRLIINLLLHANTDIVNDKQLQPHVLLILQAYPYQQTKSDEIYYLLLVVASFLYLDQQLKELFQQVLILGFLQLFLGLEIVQLVEKIKVLFFNHWLFLLSVLDFRYFMEKPFYLFFLFEERILEIIGKFLFEGFSECKKEDLAKPQKLDVIIFALVPQYILFIILIMVWLSDNAQSLDDIAMKQDLLPEIGYLDLLCQLHNVERIKLILAALVVYVQLDMLIIHAFGSELTCLHLLSQQFCVVHIQFSQEDVDLFLEAHDERVEKMFEQFVLVYEDDQHVPFIFGLLFVLVQFQDEILKVILKVFVDELYQDLVELGGQGLVVYQLLQLSVDLRDWINQDVCQFEYHLKQAEVLLFLATAEILFIQDGPQDVLIQYADQALCLLQVLEESQEILLLFVERSLLLSQVLYLFIEPRLLAKRTTMSSEGLPLRDPLKHGFDMRLLGHLGQLRILPCVTFVDAFPDLLMVLLLQNECLQLITNQRNDDLLIILSQLQLFIYQIVDVFDQEEIQAFQDLQAESLSMLYVIGIIHEILLENAQHVRCVLEPILLIDQNLFLDAQIKQMCTLSEMQVELQYVERQYLVLKYLELIVLDQGILYEVSYHHFVVPRQPHHHVLAPPVVQQMERQRYDVLVIVAYLLQILLPVLKQEVFFVNLPQFQQSDHFRIKPLSLLQFNQLYPNDLILYLILLPINQILAQLLHHLRRDVMDLHQFIPQEQANAHAE